MRDLKIVNYVHFIYLYIIKLKLYFKYVTGVSFNLRYSARIVIFLIFFIYQYKIVYLYFLYKQISKK